LVTVSNVTIQFRLMKRWLDFLFVSRAFLGVRHSKYIMQLILKFWFTDALHSKTFLTLQTDIFTLTVILQLVIQPNGKVHYSRNQWKVSYSNKTYLVGQMSRRYKSFPSAERPNGSVSKSMSTRPAMA